MATPHTAATIPLPLRSQIAYTSKGPVEYTRIGTLLPRDEYDAVFICHGTSSDCFSSDGFQPLLEAGFQVITPSRPGYGRTPLEVGRSAEQAAEGLAGLLDCLGIQCCSVVAISGGGPTGVALAAGFPERVRRLVLLAAITRTGNRQDEPAYQSQKVFYGPMHAAMWATLGLMSRLSPRSMARQTMAIFSSHDPDDALKQLRPEDIEAITHFYQGRSSRQGASNDFTHSVDVEVFARLRQPTLVIHSREDKSVPFHHAEWSLEHIPQAELCESGLTGHFYWIGPDYPAVSRRLIEFLQSKVVK